MALKTNVCLSAGVGLEDKTLSKERKTVMKKALAVLLTLCMLATLIVLPTTAAGDTTEALPKWDFTSINDKGARHEGLHTDPFRLVGFFNGINAGWKDANGAVYDGCYDLAHVLNWSHSCPVFTTTEANLAGGYHGTAIKARWGMSAVGVIFTAPASGTVKLTYHMGAESTATAVHLRGKGTLTYNTTTHEYGAGESIALAGKNLDDKVEYTVDVTKGETVYLMFGEKNTALDNAVTLCNFYMDSVEYTSLTHYPTQAEVIGMGMTASSTPRVRYIVKFNDDIGYCTTAATIAGEAVEVKVQQIIGEESGKTFTATDFVYEFTIEVPAKQMTKTICLSVKGANDAELLTGTDYTVETYCLEQITAAKKTDATNDEKNVGKVCASMLLYGYMTQQRFGYNTAHMPTIDKDFIQSILPN